MPRATGPASTSISAVPSPPAIFNDASKVKFVPLTAKDRFTALQTGDVDVLVRNTTWTLLRDTQLGLNATGVNYYDGQGFIVRKGLKVNSALELNDATICVQQGTTTELNLADYFRANKMKLRSVTFATLDEAVRAYETDRCNAFTTDASGLYAVRLKLAKPDDHVVLPEIISKEPLGPFVRHGDDQWFDVVKWTLFAMLNAEELNVTKANVDEQMKSDNPEIKRLLGTEDNFGERLGLTKDWVYRIVKLVGNYGEVFDRNVGQSSPLQDRARPQCAVDQGGHSVRAADSLISVPATGQGDGAITGSSAGPVLPRSEAAGDHLSGRAVRRARRSRLRSRPQRRREPRARQDRVRLRVLEHHRRLRHQPDVDRVLRAVLDLWPRLLGRAHQHAAGRRPRHHARHRARDRRSASPGCRRTSWSSASRPATSS